MRKVALSVGLVALMGLTACTDPYDPGQRAVGGGLLGAGAGAALGGIAGGGRGAAIGALAGGAIGAVGGAATTPRPPPPRVLQWRLPAAAAARLLPGAATATARIRVLGRVAPCACVGCMCSHPARGLVPRPSIPLNFVAGAPETGPERLQQVVERRSRLNGNDHLDRHPGRQSLQQPSAIPVAGQGHGNSV